LTIIELTETRLYEATDRFDNVFGINSVFGL